MPDQLPADAGITVEDLPFDLEPDDEGGAPPYSNTADDDIEPDAAFEFGQEFETALVDLYRLAIRQAEEYQDDKAALKAMQQGIKYNPKHILRAAVLFPELFDGNSTVNSTELFATFTICSRCKEDADAVQAYNWYCAHTPMLDELKKHLKEHYGVERGKATLAERCAAMSQSWRSQYQIEVPGGVETPEDCADELAALPEVAKVLERKESDGKA